MRRLGIESGSTAWKAAMLTTIPPTQITGIKSSKTNIYCLYFFSFLSSLLIIYAAFKNVSAGSFTVRTQHNNHCIILNLSAEWFGRMVLP